MITLDLSDSITDTTIICPIGRQKTTERSEFEIMDDPNIVCICIMVYIVLSQQWDSVTNSYHINRLLDKLMPNFVVFIHF